jgi:ribonuclease P protein component
MHTSREKLRALTGLTARGDFLNIQNSGQKWVSGSLILQVKANDTGAMRVGYTVSKKVHKSAVVRNRIKRRLRAAAADVLCVNGKAGCDYVLVGREATADKPYEVIRKDLAWCMKRTGFYQSAVDLSAADAG